MQRAQGDSKNSTREQIPQLLSSGSDLMIATAEEETAGFYYSNHATKPAIHNKEVPVNDSPYFLNSGKHADSAIASGASIHLNTNI